MTHMTLQAVRQLIANDSYAITFQSMAQYRGALLRHFDSLFEDTVVNQAAPEQVAQGTLYQGWAVYYDNLGHESYPSAWVTPFRLYHSVEEAEADFSSKPDHYRAHKVGVYVLSQPSEAAPLRLLSNGLPSADDHPRVLVYTDGVDFAGEQYFDIKTDDLWEPEQRTEVAEAATHWMPHPRARAVPSLPATPAPLDAGEMKRLRRLMKALGHADAFEATDDYVRGVLFTILGQAAGRIEGTLPGPASAPAPTVPAGDARAAFEHWFSDDGQAPRSIERSGDGYKLAQAQAAWWAWQAAWGKVLAHQPAQGQARPDWIANVVRDVAELPDRDSPADQPEMMLVSGDELRDLITRYAPASQEQAEPLSDTQIDRIARSYFSEQWAVAHAKDAIHDAFKEAGRASQAAQHEASSEPNTSES